MLATRKTENFLISTPEKPDKFPGFFPSQAMISCMAMLKLQELTLSKMSYSITNNHLSRLTFCFTNGTLSPPSTTYSGHDTDDHTQPISGQIS